MTSGAGGPASGWGRRASRCPRHGWRASASRRSCNPLSCPSVFISSFLHSSIEPGPWTRLGDELDRRHLGRTTSSGRAVLHRFPSTVATHSPLMTTAPRLRARTPCAAAAYVIAQLSPCRHSVSTHARKVGFIFAGIESERLLLTAAPGRPRSHKTNARVIRRGGRIS